MFSCYAIWLAYLATLRSASWRSLRSSKNLIYGTTLWPDKLGLLQKVRLCPCSSRNNFLFRNVWRSGIDFMRRNIWRTWKVMDGSHRLRLSYLLNGVASEVGRSNDHRLLRNPHQNFGLREDALLLLLIYHQPLVEHLLRLRILNHADAWSLRNHSVWLFNLEELATVWIYPIEQAVLLLIVIGAGDVNVLFHQVHVAFVLQLGNSRSWPQVLAGILNFEERAQRHLALGISLLSELACWRDRPVWFLVFYWDFTMLDTRKFVVLDWF